MSDNTHSLIKYLSMIAILQKGIITPSPTIIAMIMTNTKCSQETAIEAIERFNWFVETFKD